jgi:hypothetical protein
MNLTQKFEYIQDSDNLFSALFPHRFDYIYAEHTSPRESPNWQTESRHPLSDRLWKQGSHLFGVRFGQQSQYFMLDIDIDSPYHPRRDPLAISRLAGSLEPLGLTRYVACTSSYSGGLHIYFPLSTAIASWELATVVSCLIENAGFKLKLGQLELFPNAKPYARDGALSLYNAHRLPMQVGSYLVDAEFQPIWSDQQRFVQHWQVAQSDNQVGLQVLQQILQQVKRKRYRISGKADQFLNDLNAEIELGWTDFGQTNRLLGRIALREYIFHHILQGGDALTGSALAARIAAVAISLPGYEEWCNHQHEIQQRAAEWARCVESSHYFPYGVQKGKYKPIAPLSPKNLDNTELNWNQQRSLATRERIRAAIADLLNRECLPTGATARFHALTAYGIGGGSLYRHRDLWHPKFLNHDPDAEMMVECSEAAQSVENSVIDPGVNSVLEICDEASVGNAASSHYHTSLLFRMDGNSRENQEQAERSPILFPSQSGNLTAVENPLADQVISVSTDVCLPQGIELIQQAIATIKARQAEQRNGDTEDLSTPNQAHWDAHVTRIQTYLKSADPILIAEATAWMQPLFQTD